MIEFFTSKTLHGIAKQKIYIELSIQNNIIKKLKIIAGTKQYLEY